MSPEARPAECTDKSYCLEPQKRLLDVGHQRSVGFSGGDPNSNLWGPLAAALVLERPNHG